MRNAGYLTSNANTAWPFDSDLPTLDRTVARLFADGSVLLYSNDESKVAWVRDVSIENGVLSFVVVKTDDGEYDSNDSYMNLEVAATEDVYAKTGASWCFFVVECHEIIEHEGLVAKGPFRLDPAACSMEADRVTSISLYNHEPGSNENFMTDSGIRGDVTIRAGYNTYVGTDLAQAGYISAAPMQDPDSASERFRATTATIATTMPYRTLETYGRIPRETSSSKPTSATRFRLTSIAGTRSYITRRRKSTSTTFTSFCKDVARLAASAKTSSRSTTVLRSRAKRCSKRTRT